MKKKECFDFSEYKMCLNCLHSRELSDSNIVLCEKHGLKNVDDLCSHFEVDLLSINPKKLRTLKTTLSEEDFKL